MKKLFSILCAFLISSVIFFAGCSDKWTEVQSITYHTDSGSTTYTSMIYRDITYEEITENEYNEMKATQNEKPYTVSYYGFERLESSRLDTTKMCIRDRSVRASYHAARSATSKHSKRRNCRIALAV